MTRTMMLMVAVVIGFAGVAMAQQQVVSQTAPRTTRSYRSYSVTPTPRGNVRRSDPHAGEATWRHADSKATGRFGSGR